MDRVTARARNRPVTGRVSGDDIAASAGASRGAVLEHPTAELLHRVALEAQLLGDVLRRPRARGRNQAEHAPPRLALPVLLGVADDAPAARLLVEREGQPL